MVATNVSKKTSKKVQDANIPQVVEIAITIREDALQLTSEQVSRFDQGKDLAELFEQFDFTERFKHNLAKGVARSLAQNDKRIQAVYQFGESTSPGSDSGEYTLIDPSIHLICLVDLPSAGLQAYIDSLDRALTLELKSLPTSRFAKLSSALDIVLITKKDVNQRRGYAALLTSLHAPALAVWKMD